MEFKIVEGKGVICPNCKELINRWLESVGGVDYIFTFSPKGEIIELNSDHWGETTIHCPNCDAELDSQIIPALRKALVRR